MPLAYSCLRRNGSILIFTLWVLAFFSILSVSVYRLVYSQLNLGRAFEERTVSAYLAKSAVTFFQATRKFENPAYDSIGALSRKITRQFGRLSFTYTAMDEESKLDINTATVDMIARLPGVDAQLASAVAHSSLRPFHLKEELLQVQGWTQDIFNSCKEYISVHSAGWIDLNTAPPEVLGAVVTDGSLCRGIQEFRAGPDGKEGTEDDRVFESASSMAQSLRAFRGLSTSEEAMLSDLIGQGLLGVRGKYFCLDIMTVVSGRAAMRYRIWLDDKTILQWEES